MNRRYQGVALALPLFFAMLAGCESPRHALRARDRDPDVAHASAETEEPESSKILDVQSDGKNAKPFFRSSRRSGALSSEAREIEGSLGIH
jgi:hypothetical protein